MGDRVYVTTYEAVGKGAEIARAFYDELKAAKDGQWKIAESLGADGYRPGYGGGIKSLLFKTTEVPTGWRRLGREKGLIECQPHKGTKAGKAALAILKTAPQRPQDHALADKFGFEGRSPIDGTFIYHATALKVSHPSERFFIRLPRVSDDGYEPPETLVEVRESDFMRAVEDHNASVKEEARAA